MRVESARSHSIATQVLECTRLRDHSQGFRTLDRKAIWLWSFAASNCFPCRRLARLAQEIGERSWPFLRSLVLVRESTIYPETNQASYRNHRVAIHPARLNFNPNPKRISVKLKLFSRHFDDVATHVLSALRANGMRWNGRAATWACRQLLGLLVVMRPSLVASRVGVTSLGNCHDLTSNHQLKCVVLFFCLVFGSRQVRHVVHSSQSSVFRVLKSYPSPDSVSWLKSGVGVFPL